MRDTFCGWIGRFNVSNIFIFAKLSYRFMAILFKITSVLQNGKLTLKFIWKCKGCKIAKTILKRDQIGGLILCDFKTYKGTVIKTAQHKDKKKKKQINRTESRIKETHIWKADLWQRGTGNAVEKESTLQQQ